MYRETFSKSLKTETSVNQWTPAPNGIDGPSQASIQCAQTKPKVNCVCDAFLDALKGRLNTNLQNIITAHVCKSPPDLDAGLLLVAKLRGDCYLCSWIAMLD